MPGYVERALTRFGHLIPKILQHQPHKHTVPTYGATIQYAKDDDATNLLSKKRKNTSNKFSELFSTTAELWIRQCSQH
jgi:hypothetical protein